MTCPICGRPSAFNATRFDRRCGPCHNFGIDSVSGGLITVRLRDWISDTQDRIIEADNLDTYRAWLADLRKLVPQ